jgi:hypothetical protein
MAVPAAPAITESATRAVQDGLHGSLSFATGQSRGRAGKRWCSHALIEAAVSEGTIVSHHRPDSFWAGASRLLLF